MTSRKIRRDGLIALAWFALVAVYCAIGVYAWHAMPPDTDHGIAAVGTGLVCISGAATSRHRVRWLVIALVCFAVALINAALVADLWVVSVAVLGIVSVCGVALHDPDPV